MKNSIYASFLLLGAAFTVSCNNANNKAAENDSTLQNEQTTGTSRTSQVVPGEYVNLNTGEPVNIIADPVTGIAIDQSTQQPVELYYNPSTNDTLYQSGMKVNSLLIKEKEGKYRLDDTKIKIDGDEIKIKDDSSKIKIDGDEMKIKSPDGKVKVDGEDVKVK
jgi:ABC-type Fe3+-citrate transport system substrate-binding protein